MSTPPILSLSATFAKPADHIPEKRGWKEGWGRRYKTVGRLKAPFLLIWKPNHLNLEDGGCRLKAFPNNPPDGVWCSLGLCHRRVLETQRELSSPIGDQPHTDDHQRQNTREKKQERDSKVGVLHEPSATNPTASSREESKKSTED